MNEFLLVMGSIISAGVATTLYFFRRGGIYNPIIEEAPTSPQNTPISDDVATSSSPVVETLVAPVYSPTDRLYTVAYGLLGKHLSLDPSIPPEVGCAQSVSKVLQECGYKLPKKGISTVAGLTDWMLKHGFTEVITYKKGLVITGRSPSYAHIGITGEKWIMSNTSENEASKGLVKGKWQSNYKKASWYKTFPLVRLFEPV